MEEEKKVIPKQSFEKCPECKSINLITDDDTGETVCGDCGFVLLEQIVDKGPEWRAYTHEEETERSRVGIPENLTVHDKSLSTTLKPIGRDPFGKTLRPGTLIEMRRLSMWQERLKVHSATEKNLVQAMTELTRLADKLNIPSKSTIRKIAAVIYRKALDKSLIRGRSIIAMVPACLYIACRQTETPRTIQEVADASLVDKKEVGRCYRLLVKTLEIPIPITDPIKCISRIAEKIGISGKTQGRAIEILQEAKKKRLSGGRGPMGLAAAALYIACLENNEQKKGRFGFMGSITQKDIAETAGVTEVTVRNRYKELVKKLNIEISIRSEKIALFYCNT